MFVWLGFQQEFLDEMLRWDEFGNQTVQPQCCTCGKLLRTAMESVEAESCDVIQELFRCDSCGEFTECRDCSLKRHGRTPLHILSVSSLIFAYLMFK